jgi:hypothetical protein
VGGYSSTTDKGKKLEDEVADIYRQLDGTQVVTPNINMMGVQVDIYVEIESSDGIISRYAIDAKNYDKPVGAEETRKCVTDFRLLKLQDKIDQGIIVAANGFTKDASAAAVESGVKIINIKDLRNRLHFDFKPYLIKWIERYEQEEANKMQIYIPLTAKDDQGKGIGELDEYLLNWLKQPGIHITLLGNYGTGKSTTLKRLMYMQAKRYLADSDERIPIFVELKGFRQAPKSRQLITDIIVNEFGVKGNFNFAKFQELSEKGKFLIILDGFDEMADRVLDGLPNEHFDELSTLACNNGKVILSSRTHYFRDYDHIMEVQGEARDLYSRIEGRSGFQILFLNSFSEEDIDTYLESSFKVEWENYKKVIKNTYDLKSLAEVPILMNMIVQILPEMMRDNVKINRSEIYQKFTDRWFRREAWRRGVHITERFYFCKQLSLHFYKKQENYVHWRALPEYIKNYFKDRINSPTDLDIFEADVRTSNFLVRKPDSGNYYFVHKSFMEFFVARCFHDNIINKVVNGLDDLNDFIKSRVIYEFLVEMLDEDDLELLRRDIFRKENEDFLKLVYNDNDSTNKIYNNPQSIGNGAYLLMKKGISLDNAVLDAAKLSGITLSNISFKGTSLRGVDFSFCILTNVDFYQADLSYAKFDGSMLDNINFKGAKLEKASFLKTELDNKTTTSLSRSQYWGTIKINDKYRSKITKAHGKAVIMVK